MDCSDAEMLRINENLSFEIDCIDFNDSLTIETFLHCPPSEVEICWAKFELSLAKLATERFFQGTLAALDGLSSQSGTSGDIPAKEISLRCLINLGANASSKYFSHTKIGSSLVSLSRNIILSRV